MKKQGFLKGSAILFAMVIITKALGLVYKIPLTRLLGGTGMGYFSSTYSVFTPIFASVISGIPSTMSRISAENYAFERYSNLRKQRRYAHIVFGFFGIVTAMLTILLSGFLSENIMHTPSAKYALVSVAPSVVFCTFMSVERGYYEGLHNMIPTATSEITETFFRLVLGLGFAYYASSYAMEQFEQKGSFLGIVSNSPEDFRMDFLPYVVASAILGSSLASGISAIYIFVSTRIHGDGITKQMLEKDRITDSFSKTAKLLLKYSFPVAIITVITTLTNMIDMLTINPCLEIALKKSPDTFRALGTDLSSMPNFIYGSYTGLAVTVYGLVPTVTAMFGKSLLPTLTSAFVKGDKQGISENLDRMLMISSYTAIPCGIGIAVLSEPILHFIFGNKDMEILVASRPLAVLGIAVIFSGISLPCFVILQTLGKSVRNIVIMVAGGIIKLVLNVVLIQIPEIGITGASVSTAVSEMFVCILTLISIYQLADTECKVKETYIKPLYAGVLCGISAYLTYSLLNTQNFITINFRILLLFSVIAGGIIYLFSLYLLCEMPKNLIKYVFLKKI